MDFRFSCVFVALFACISLAEPLPNLAEYSDRLREVRSAKPIVENFDYRPEGWEMSEHFKWVEKEGINGTGALLGERTQPKTSPYAKKLFRLSKGVVYTLSVTYRTQMEYNPQLTVEECFCVRYQRGGKVVSGSFTATTNPHSREDWFTKKLEFSIPEDCDEEVIVHLLIRTDRIGKVWYENVTIEPSALSASIAYPMYPKMMTWAKDGNFRYRVLVPTGSKEEDCRLLVEGTGKKLLLPVKDGFAEGSLVGMNAGEIRLKATLLDTKLKTILARSDDGFIVRSVPTRKGQITFDKDGTFLKDGQRHLPIGIFLGIIRPHDRDIFKRVRAAGFNTVQGIGQNLLYHGKLGTFKESILASVREMDKNGLDYLYAIKYQIPSLKGQGRYTDKLDDVTGLDNVTRYIVNTLKNEPNLLGWYVSDENPVSQIPQIQSLRELISREDPWHPTMTLTCHFNDYYPFARTGDCLMTDVYPVGPATRTGARQDQRLCRIFLERVNETGSIPVWVPQVFAWAASTGVLPFRYPTDREIRSMVLMGTVCGAKAYFFYSYHHVMYYSEDKDPGHSGEQWARIARTATLLKALTPFILSQEEPPKLSVRQISGATISARAFKKDGKVVVVVVADGPDKAVADIQVEGRKDLKSLFGGIQKNEDGSYRFEAMHIDSDILVAPKTNLPDDKEL